MRSEECACRSDEANETESESNVLGTSFNDIHQGSRVKLTIVIVMVVALVDNKVLFRVSDHVEDRLSLIKGAKLVVSAVEESDRHSVDCSKVNYL